MIGQLKSVMQPRQNVPAAGDFAAYNEISAAFYRDTTQFSSRNKSGLTFNFAIKSVTPVLSSCLLFKNILTRLLMIFDQARKYVVLENLK